LLDDATAAAQATTLGLGTGDSPTFTGLTLSADIAMGGANIDDLGVLFLKEQAAADADVIASGQIWVKTATPNQLWFTDDAGTDFQLGLSGGLDNVVEDTTPVLGGALDLGGFDMTGGGVITLVEQAAAEADVAGNGQIWVKTATPNQLWFTDDAGTDVQLGVSGTAASDTAAGIIELATDAETITGTATDRATTPANITAFTGTTATVTVGTIATGVWQGTAIDQTYLTGQSGTNTGDEPAADLTTAGVIEIATVAETNTGTDATRAVSPDGLDGWTGSAQVTTLGTIATGVWQGTAVTASYMAAASDTAQGAVELSTDAETVTGTATDRAVTPANVASAYKAQGKETIGMPAAAMTSTTTNGAADGLTELVTNDIMLATKDFDASTLEKAQFVVPMPKSWDEGTVTAQFYWTHTAGATFTVVWGLRGVAFGNSDAMDTAMGTGQTAADTGGTDADLYISPETSAITIAGTPAAGDLVVFEAYRDASNGSDGHTADARLIAVKLHITTDAKDDT
jgi:hypothetical protein